MNPLITTHDAEALIRAALPTPATERVALATAIGRVLAEPITADRDLPPYPRAMMDGIAFHSSSPPPFTIAGLHAAGGPPPNLLGPGRAWEIMTGASVPADCDTVVPYEDLSEDHCDILDAWQPGQCIHSAGSDARRGDVLVAAGAAIGAPEIAIAASVGMTTLEVTVLPRIALISSGNEVVDVEATPEPWQIRRSNGPMLEAILRHAGLPVVAHHHVPDDEAATRAAIDDALASADVVILCGGISMGKKDLMRPLLEAKLGQPAFHGVAQKPGKPLAFWAGPPLVFALPGNPVSVLATFSRYVLPALRKLSGQVTAPVMRTLPQGVQPLPKMAWLVALDAAGHPRFVSNSGDFASLAGAVGFIEIPPGIDTSHHPVLSFYPSILLA